MFACIHCRGASVLACAYAFSPLVEEAAPDTAIFNIDGLGRLLGPPESVAQAIARRAASEGVEASVAIAPNPDAALYAARGLVGITVVWRPEDLGELPIELLEPPPEILETLDCWGIRTFRDLAALPANGIAERLGEAGVRLQQMARAQSHRPLRPAYPQPVFEELLELEYPVSLLEPLAFILGRLLADLCRKLEERGLATHELRLALRLEGGGEFTRSLRLPVPMRHPRAFLKLMQLDLESHPPKAPVIAVAIAAEPALPRTQQEGLFTPLSPEPEKLELTLARIEAMVGEGNVGSPELLDTYRPDAFYVHRHLPLPKFAPSGKPALGKRLAFRAYRPPRPASVELSGGHPVHVAAQGIRGRVAKTAGPWRASGDWWTGGAWARDEWDIELSDGSLYRIYRAGANWFVEGCYD